MANFDPLRGLALYADMFLGSQSGLIVWVPVYLFVLPGFVLLARRDRRQAGLLLGCVLGLLGDLHLCLRHSRCVTGLRIASAILRRVCAILCALRGGCFHAYMDHPPYTARHTHTLSGRSRLTVPLSRIKAVGQTCWC